MVDCEQHTITKVQHEHYRCKICREMFVKSDRLHKLEDEMSTMNSKMKQYEKILKPLRMIK